MVMKLNRFFTTGGQSNLALGEEPNSKIGTWPLFRLPQKLEFFSLSLHHINL
jgi:hypothetical protein